ncbi:MAG: hypothetical protein ACJ762_11095 [Solirubrobacteraceae bacterium]
MLVASPSRRPLAVAAACVAAGLAVLVFALASTRAPLADSERAAALVPAPAVVKTAVTPAPAPATTGVAGDPLADMRAQWRRKLVANEHAHVPAAWVSGFYPLYERAQNAFGVTWLLIASVHLQETAFSTAPGTYHGLNFAGCCAGPMQFNVTNGAGGVGSTWERYRGSYRRAARPASYPNPTAAHPSVYDDFDAIMAAANLLRDNGARVTLDGTAWQAAYDYYGHDANGVGYADEVLARAIGWSQHGFAINREVDPGLRAAVDAAWGAPARAALVPDEPPAPRKKHKQG